MPSKPTILDQKREAKQHLPVASFTHVLKDLPPDAKMSSAITLANDWIGISLYCEDLNCENWRNRGVYYARLNLSTGESACQRVLVDFFDFWAIQLCKLPENKVLLITNAEWALIDATGQIIKSGVTSLKAPRNSRCYFSAAQISLRDCAPQKYFFYRTDSEQHLLIADVENDDIAFRDISYPIKKKDFTLGDILFVWPDGLALGSAYMKDEVNIHNYNNKVVLCSMADDKKEFSLKEICALTSAYKDAEFHVSSEGDSIMFAAIYGSHMLSIYKRNVNYFFDVTLEKSLWDSDGWRFVRHLDDNRFVYLYRNQYWLYDPSMEDRRPLMVSFAPEGAKIINRHMTPEGERIVVYSKNGEYQVLVDRIALTHSDFSEKACIEELAKLTIFPKVIDELVTGYVGFFKPPLKTMAPPCLPLPLQKTMSELYYRNIDEKDAVSLQKRKALKDLSDLLWNNLSKLEKDPTLFKIYVAQVRAQNPLAEKGMSSKTKDFLAEVESLSPKQSAQQCRIM